MKPEFTDEENFVIAYYRDKKASSSTRSVMTDGVRVLVAIGFAIYSLLAEDILWGLIAFGILLFSECRNMMTTARYIRIYRSIFDKYALALEQEDGGRENGGD